MCMYYIKYYSCVMVLLGSALAMHIYVYKIDSFHGVGNYTESHFEIGQ